MNNYLLAGLIFLNFLLIYYYNKKKIKNFFIKKKIKSVNLDEVNEIFLPSKNGKQSKIFIRLNLWRRERDSNP